MRKGVYAGSFDPVTNGHLWMIEHGVGMFDEMIVAIGDNPDKSYTFSLAERLAMLRETTAHLPSLRVESFENSFLVNYAREQGANFILRGIREAADYEFERKMRYVNADLAPHIDTVFLMPPREIAEVSSTMVKGLVGPAGWQGVVRQYVPEPVFNRFLALRAGRTSTLSLDISETKGA
ncbi:pantetheine-phosphate adenylyltransferase [Iodobacter arcticus]|uniref:Phosphopantetheine adenylyltransferase n=1 Tax=Iodobacter arcticus TaxID=590593 RepID=A0ABW2QTC0_9NEIS|nr:pantetheine-phosphate adenylyltransferase [Janthinobacterium sp. B9-8]AMC35816.1 pantetheine-phosphate adenylyltransferase [Janthinobacterium sp. B9-8]